MSTEQTNQWVLDVAEFHKTFGHPIHLHPAIPSIDRMLLRANMQLEELVELQLAQTKGDLPQIADAIVDNIYYLIGTAHEYGLGFILPELFAEVQRSNMSKLGEDGKPIYREDGKIMKGPNFSLPDLHSIIERRLNVTDSTEQSSSSPESEEQEADDIIGTFILDNEAQKETFVPNSNFGKLKAEAGEPAVTPSIDEAIALLGTAGDALKEFVKDRKDNSHRNEASLRAGISVLDVIEWVAKNNVRMESGYWRKDYSSIAYTDERIVEEFFKDHPGEPTSTKLSDDQKWALGVAIITWVRLHDDDYGIPAYKVYEDFKADEANNIHNPVTPSK